MPTIAPTILVHNEEDFLTCVENSIMQELATIWQLDVLNRSMYNAATWAEPERIAKLAPNLTWELDLMIDNPLPYIEQCKKRGMHIHRALIHAEISQPLQSTLQQARAYVEEVGLSLNPETDVEILDELHHLIDAVLIMGVHPGSSGQAFLGESVLQKIEEVRALYPHLRIIVDGGVKLHNAAHIVQAGADQLCINSALWEAKDLRETFQRFAGIHA